MTSCSARASKSKASSETQPSILAAAEDLEDGFEIVTASAAVGPVQLVHMDVADEIEVAVDQGGVRLGLIDGVVDVEHGSDGRAIDFAHDGDGFFEGHDDVGLFGGERLDQNGDASVVGMRREGSEALGKAAGGLFAGGAAGGGALVGRAEDDDAAGGRDRRRDR